MTYLDKYSVIVDQALYEASFVLLLLSAAVRLAKKEAVALYLLWLAAASAIVLMSRNW